MCFARFPLVSRSFLARFTPVPRRTDNSVILPRVLIDTPDQSSVGERRKESLERNDGGKRGIGASRELVQRFHQAGALSLSLSFSLFVVGENFQRSTEKR